MTTQPQIESFVDLKENGMTEKRKEIYDILKSIGPCTWFKICKYTGKPTNEVTSRLRELVDIGWAVEHGYEYNDDTHRNNTVYKALSVQGPRRVKGYKNTGLYINVTDVEDIFAKKNVVTKDYIIKFVNGECAEVIFVKANLTIRQVKVISDTANGMMVFANETTTLKVPIITRITETGR